MKNADRSPEISGVSSEEDLRGLEKRSIVKAVFSCGRYGKKGNCMFTGDVRIQCICPKV